MPKLEVPGDTNNNVPQVVREAASGVPSATLMLQ